MAKVFTDIMLDVDLFEKEINDFHDLLESKEELSEKYEILPFFREREVLSSQIAAVFPELNVPNKIAFEFDIFGDFACDLAVGNSDNNAYCLIEFEDARKNSLFQEETKYKPSYGKRLEHGYSQIIDWFCKLDGLQRSQDMIDRYNASTVDFYGILIIGRNKFLDSTLTRRLEWRSKNIVVNSKRIYIYTFDEVLANLKEKLSLYKIYKNNTADIK